MEINWRSTRLRTNDGIYLDIPNNEIVRETIVNLHYPTQVARDADSRGHRLQDPAQSRQGCAYARNQKR